MPEFSHSAETEDPLANWANRLALSEAEVAAIRRTGVIGSELRGRSTRIYRLYFYIAGKRRSKYLGAKEGDITSMRHRLEELKRIRTQRSCHRQWLALAARETRRKWNEIQNQLFPILQANGVYLHGRRLRRRRGVKAG